MAVRSGTPLDHGLRWYATVLLATALTGPCEASPAAPSPQQDPVAVRLAELANVVRQEAGCDTLEWYEDAAEVARRHSADMEARQFFSHVNPDGLNPFDRLAEAGIHYKAAAENILHGEATASRALGLWLESPGHRENLVNCDFTHHGVGRVDSYWTHIFLRDPLHGTPGTRAGAAASVRGSVR